MQNRNSAVGLVVLILASALVLSLLASFLYIKKIKTDLVMIRAALLKDNQALKNETELLQDKLNQSADLVSNIERERRSYDSQIASLKEENEKLRTTVDEKVADLQKKKDILKKKIAKMQNAPLSDWIKTMMNAQTDQRVKDILNNTLSKIDMVKSGKSVSLEPIEVSSTGRKGTVLTIDRRNDLIVISMGSKDGIAEGDRCYIYSKDDKELASAEIISARYTIAAAFVDDMNYGVNIKSIKEGLNVSMAEKK